MGSYLDRYDQTETVELGDGFWVKIKLNLTLDEDEAAQHALVDPRMESRPLDQHPRMQGRKRRRNTEEIRATTTTVDTPAYHRELLFHAIADWNLTDRDGHVIPLSPPDRKREAIKMLTRNDKNRIVKRLTEHAEQADRDEDDEDAFRDGDQGGADPTE